MQLFNSSKILSLKIDKFFKDGILKDLNSTYTVTGEVEQEGEVIHAFNTDHHEPPALHIG